MLDVSESTAEIKSGGDVCPAGLLVGARVAAAGAGVVGPAVGAENDGAAVICA